MLSSTGMYASRIHQGFTGIDIPFHIVNIRIKLFAMQTFFMPFAVRFNQMKQLG